jgi:16S rRNA G966 N2-methylase RsmD
MEKHSQALSVIRENVESLGVRDRVTVLRGAAITLIPKHECQIAFVDPPYEQASEYAGSMNALAASACELVIAQHAVRFNVAEAYGPLKRVRVLRQGDNELSFFDRSA